MREEYGREEEILCEILNMAEAMLSHGAEVNRVEDTVQRMGKAYGASQMQVFVITSSILVTMMFEDGRQITQSRRVKDVAATDFYKMEELNALSRECCRQPIEIHRLQQEILRIEEQKHPRIYTYLGSVLGVAGFCMFFGGNIKDGVVAGVFAVLICYLQEHLQNRCPNRVVFLLLCSFVCGVGICIVAGLWQKLHVDKIMIGDIMVLIPGIALTNGVRDILIGDTISGFMRLIEALLWAGALAVGFMAAIWIVTYLGING